MRQKINYTANIEINYKSWEKANNVLIKSRLVIKLIKAGLY
jgi:hypothetical protein